MQKTMRPCCRNERLCTIAHKLAAAVNRFCGVENHGQLQINAIAAQSGAELCTPQPGGQVRACPFTSSAQSTCCSALAHARRVRVYMTQQVLPCFTFSRSPASSPSADALRALAGISPPACQQVSGWGEMQGEDAHGTVEQHDGRAVGEGRGGEGELSRNLQEKMHL